jgi:hypothetical protein
MAGPAPDINPRTPPPPTIPTTPDVVVPSSPPPTSRPAKTIDFRPTLGISEEYTDNFNRSSQDPIANLRSTIFPGFEVRLDTGFLTGQAVYTLSAFHDSAVERFGVHHAFVGQLAWQAAPRWKFTLADTLTQSDNPAQADRLDLRLARQEFTSNLLSLSSDYSLGLIDTTEYYRLSTFASAQQTTTTHTFGATGLVPLGRIHAVRLGYEYLNSETTVGRPGTLVVTGAFSNSTTLGHQLTGSFSRDLTKDTTAGVTATYAVREQVLATARTNFSRWNVSLFNNYVVAEKIIVHGNIGLTQLDSDGSKPRLLLTSNTEVTYYLGSAVLGLKVERGFSESFAQGQNFGVIETSGISGSLSYRFSPLLTGSATGGYRENKFTGLGGGGQAGREDQIVTVNSSLSYQVLRWLTATVDYTYTHAKSSVPASQTGFVENRIRGALNALLY